VLRDHRIHGRFAIRPVPRSAVMFVMKRLVTVSVTFAL